MTSDLGPRDLASDVRRSMATTADDPVFVDTNVLVYANTVRSPLHIRAQLALQDLSASAIPLWISRQIRREYLATLSRPQTFSAPVAPAALVAVVVCFLSSRIYWLARAVVSRPRRSADRRFPGDAPTVGESLGEGLLDPPFG